MLGKILAKSTSAAATNEPKKRWNFTKKDPNAMDIDSMTTEQRAEAMKKGLCFGLERGGISIEIVQKRRGKKRRKRRKRKRRRSGPRKSSNSMSGHYTPQWTRMNRRNSRRILLEGTWIDASVSHTSHSLCNSGRHF